MHVDLIAVETKMPIWVQEGFNEYAQRLSKEQALKLSKIFARKRKKPTDITHLMMEV